MPIRVVQIDRSIDILLTTIKSNNCKLQAQLNETFDNILNITNDKKWNYDKIVDLSIMHFFQCLATV